MGNVKMKQYHLYRFRQLTNNNSQPQLNGGVLMRNTQKTLKVLALLLPAFFLLFVLSSGCETEKEVIKEVPVEVIDTVFVEIISVDSIYANPDSITEGGSITLTAQVSTVEPTGTVAFAWFAAAGTLSDATGDTVTWKAPDDPGVYAVTVHATDGEFIGLGSRMIGVGMYAPTETPYYLGDMACAGCHAGKHDEWAETGHAHAWETLQNSGNPQPFCNPCHTVGYEPDPNTGNSGYDEAPIEKFENVQCENCHGAASDHVENVDPTLITVSYDVQTCGKCHDGTHHPFLTEWLTSPHNFDNIRTGSCEGCHEGVAASIRLSGESAAHPLDQFYGSGTITERPDTTEAPLQPHVCQTCHDPHSDENPGQLRTVADVPLVEANGESPVVTAGGVGKLCMHCHHARRGPESQIANGYAHFGPHANPQGDILSAKSASHGVAAPDYPWPGPSHLLVQNSCKTCHLSTVEFGGGPGGAAVVGHEFIPKPEACVNCHGPITSFEDIPAAADFDGNGVIEGLQIEVDGLLHLLEEALLADGLDTTGVGFDGALGDTLRSSVRQRTAGYNLVYVEDDKSRGIHNPDYVVQLLQQSIDYLGSTLPENAKIIEGDNEAVKNW
jgi:hypothetical protein